MANATHKPNSVSTVNAYSKEDAYTYYPLIVIGAGETGIAMGCQLKEKLGFDQFRIFDRQAGLGGTWWVNKYPGVQCDVPAIFYSFSFRPAYKWSPYGHEIVDYMHEVCQHYQITDKIQLNTDVQGLRWLEEEQVWEATLLHLQPGMGDLTSADRRNKIEMEGEASVVLRKEYIRAKLVVSAVGGLVEPRGWPESIPGSDTFEGEIFHSARWRSDVDLKDKDIVVMGTGCTGAQLTPLLTSAPYHAKSVTQLMRSPPWCHPAPVPPGGRKWWAKNGVRLCRTIPGFARLLRLSAFLNTEMSFFIIFKKYALSQKLTKGVEEKLIDYMKSKAPAKYHDMLTPDYGIGCKRIIFDVNWYESMNNPKYTLSTQPLTHVGPKSVTVGPGRTYPPMSKTDSKAPTDEVEIPADVVIMANGFDVSTWLHPLLVEGREGKKLHEVWQERGGAQAYMGCTLDGFPNFFICFGPNTATGHSSVILASENMVQYIIRLVRPILNGDAKIVEVKKEAEIEWTRKIQEELKDSVWMTGGCQSWYRNDDNWNATTYPRSQIDYSIRCMFPRYSHYDIAYTAKGLRKMRLRRAFRIVALVLTLMGTYKMRQLGGGSWRNVPFVFRQILTMATVQALGKVKSGVEGLQKVLVGA
ncbi:hypothetical protein MMC25_001811 [Agyrium rufum]|nr:hypothetical protein [Agyrium rufum]